MDETLPVLLEIARAPVALLLDQPEITLLKTAGKLFQQEFYDHALLDVWNAAIHNLRRRVEAYGVDLFLSVVKSEAGRKSYNQNGDTLNENWEGVDDLVLIAGATRLGLLNPKAGKSLEMINWMRNHASPAHGTDHAVQREDVIALVLMLQVNLFAASLPDPGHSVSTLFEPVKNTIITGTQLGLLHDQINALPNQDLRICFGFMMDLLCKGVEPAAGNAKKLFSTAWQRATEELKKTAGAKYHSLTIDPTSDDSQDAGARTRLLDFLTQVGGIAYIPDAVRAAVYRTASKALATAKDSSYGWAAEESAAKTLAQFGAYVPSICFEEVYQEILVVWCGNYWGRSQAHLTLQPFIDSLNTEQIRRVVKMFSENARVRSELFQDKPRQRATNLLEALKQRVTIEAHKTEVDLAIASVSNA